MRASILCLIILGMLCIAVTPANACPGGYIPCGNYCCPG